MAWNKRNQFFVSGAVVALGLIIIASWKRDADGTEKPKDSYAESTGLSSLNRNAGLDKVEVAAAAAHADSTSEIPTLTLRCRAVIPSHVSSDAETTIAYALQKELQASTNLFNPQTTKLGPEIHRDRDADTFTFDVALALRRPIKL